jgi:hypothetical protein
VSKNKDNLNKDRSWLKPVMVFYAKTTAWIIFPLLLALLLGNYFSKSAGGQTMFLVCIMAGFGVSCSGIYQEIKKYKKDLDDK